MSAYQNEKDQIKAKLWRLRGLKDTDYRLLTGSLKRDFDDVSRYINLLAGQHAYSELYDLIHEAFGNEIPISTGTVGQYFSNHMVSEKTGTYCAAPLNAAAILAPVDDKCHKRVYSCIYDSEKGYLFLPKTNVKSREGYLHLLEFHGFSKAELDNLRAQGLDKVHIYNFQEMPFPGVTTPQTLTELEQNHLRPTPVTPVRRSEKGDSAMIYLVFLLVILLLLSLILAYTYKNRAS
jgi:hypothetical protein